ncbi:MAG: triacylglycerol lipase [Pseudomonas sp.]|uniref:esterase/lipase family protein n=1 Tax=Pseudomonas sp. TaxID=306 RepID=UPI003398AB3D
MLAERTTRYPLVLVPGLLGFIRLLGYPYWYGIESKLRSLGFQVYPVRVSPLHASEVRGEQLLERIQALLLETGADKVNLIGHSQGALTARYAAAKRPEWIASVTSVSGPNHGSELADYCQRQAPVGTWRERLFAWAMRSTARWIGWLESGAIGPTLPLDARACGESLSTAGVALFNHRYPQGLPEVWGGEGAEEVAGVRYYSWSGTLQPGLTNRGGNLFDGPNLACRLFAQTFTREIGQCDGMVGRFSSHLGKVIGDQYPLDHFDSINQTFGLVGKGADPVGLFIEHGRRLAEAGL